jgi:glucosamine 6-phosphate synthetase-like amidotransferase/phosphosugar isomerase protein
MCGIVGYVGPQDATPIILNGLKRLEYRGYDSAGLAVLENSAIQVRREVGKLSRLVALLQESPVHGQIGSSAPFRVQVGARSTPPGTTFAAWEACSRRRQPAFRRTCVRGAAFKARVGDASSSGHSGAVAQDRLNRAPGILGHAYNVRNQSHLKHLERVSFATQNEYAKANGPVGGNPCQAF